MILTKEQKQAIQDINNNSAIVACPGSGKTTILINKMILCSRDLKNYNGFIALSFTKKSSYELKLRFKRKSNSMNNNFFGTIDDFFANEIIRPFLSNVWGGSSKDLEIIKVLNDEESLNFVDDPSKKKLNLNDVEADSGFKGLFRDGKILINSINALALLVIKKSNSCRRYLKSRYKYIFIDEYQDTSYDQHLVFLEILDLKLVSTIVGDINQSIYKWNDASPEYLLSLVRDNGFKEYKISKNHRCHPSITNYANVFLGISDEILEGDKKIYKLILNDDSKSRYKKLDKLIGNIIKKFNFNNNEVAIISRLNSAIECYSKQTELSHKIYLDDPLDKIGCKASIICTDLLKYKFSKKISIYEIYNKNSVIRNSISLNKFREIFKSDDNDEFLENIRCLFGFLSLNIDIEPALAATNTILKDDKYIKMYMPDDINDIQMLNIHKSKGLEFKVVIHIGLEALSFPLVTKNDGIWGVKDMKEEKNLHFVAITRAEKLCFLISMTKRVNSNLVESDAEPSEFFTYPYLEDHIKDLGQR